MKLLFCSILLGSASVAFALPTVYVNLSDQAYSGAYYNPFNNDNFQGGTNVQHSTSTGFLPQMSATIGDSAASVWGRADTVASPIDDGSSVPAIWNADCSSAASGSAYMGALHATCRAVQEITPFSVSYAQTDSDGISHENTSFNPLIATASAEMDISAQDSVTVTGTLPAGTLVRVRLGLAVDCGVTVFGGGSGSQVGAQAYCQIHNGTQNYNSDSLNFNSATDGSSVSTNEVFSVPIGTTLYVVQSLSAKAYASSDLGASGMYLPLSDKPPTGSATADAGNTAHFYLDVLDAGASLNSVSGHNYSAPPQLTLIPTNAPGFTLSAACVPLQTWVLQYSSDAIHWTDAGTNQADNNGQLLITLPAPDTASKFYRFRSP
jgi:hypothetical protein